VLEFAIFFINCCNGNSETLSKDKNIVDQEKVMKKLKIFFLNYHTKLNFIF